MKRFKPASAGVLALLVSSLLGAIHAQADDGLLWVGSAHSVATTSERLQALLSRKGITLFARIDHGAGARSVGRSLPPTELLIFGNPKLGTPLMECQPSVAVDLPQKMLISEDEEGRVWLSYTAPAYLAQRHRIEGCDAVLQTVSGALAALARAAASP
ncbi:DUF302 domain-containing protein [Aestuariirhabdus litorea]|uniref:DUF302 domain-containing protein n=1 Tax=Aestuariirhabdus litorea TaxID=2528527 RepID=A0A3P3VR26_9GAMM|nr:DUF302 domain-containing protein [Aestuariirhabdus litorea]RRJ84126.1 DUF302 domain-containing protein [Aestuariirhabdus litorea]RWW97345.1 DUF302 domain-containing protein [Endozoicomonadaceae bacterium GTF-13]